MSEDIYRQDFMHANLSRPLEERSQAMTTNQTPETAEGMTPRTEAFCATPRGLGTGYYQALDFARELESESNRLSAHVVKIERDLSTANAARRDAEAKVEEMREVLEGIEAVVDPSSHWGKRIAQALSTTIPGKSRVAELEREVERLRGALIEVEDANQISRVLDIVERTLGPWKTRQALTPPKAASVDTCPECGTKHGCLCDDAEPEKSSAAGGVLVRCETCGTPCNNLGGEIWCHNSNCPEYHVGVEVRPATAPEGEVRA